MLEHNALAVPENCMQCGDTQRISPLLPASAELPVGIKFAILPATSPFKCAIRSRLSDVV